MPRPTILGDVPASISTPAERGARRVSSVLRQQANALKRACLDLHKAVSRHGRAAVEAELGATKAAELSVFYGKLKALAEDFGATGLSDLPE